MQPHNQFELLKARPARVKHVREQQAQHAIPNIQAVNQKMSVKLNINKPFKNAYAKEEKFKGK